MAEKLSARKCIACQGGRPPLSAARQQELLAQLDDAWEVVDTHHLHRTFKFPDFAGALAFVNRVGAVAEQENHHPDIRLTWGKVGITLFTHKIGGLCEGDFILAAKIDEL